VDGKRVDASSWSYGAANRTLTISLPSRPVAKQTTVAFTTAE
jgi:hypothetical protein